LVNSCCNLAFELKRPDISRQHKFANVVLPERESTRLLVVNSKIASEPPKNSGVNWRRTDKIQTFFAKWLLSQDVSLEDDLRQNSLGNVFPIYVGLLLGKNLPSAKEAMYLCLITASCIHRLNFDGNEFLECAVLTESGEDPVDEVSTPFEPAR
jgi:hypothetical protein